MICFVFVVPVSLVQFDGLFTHMLQGYFPVKVQLYDCSSDSEITHPE